MSKELTQMDVQNMLGGQVLRIAQMEVSLSEANAEVEKLRAEVKRLETLAESNTSSRKG